jgi:general secretion pathway protein K
MSAVARERRSERGLALVSVLWALSILSLIAASMTSTGRLSAAMERNALRRAEADRLAESAIALGILGLLDPRPERRWRVDGVAQDIVFGGVSLRISIQDEFGLIDLNQAGVELFRGLLRSTGATEVEAERLADRIVDWRSSAAPGSQSSNAADYAAADLPYEPRKAPFQSVDELNLVLGVTPEIFSRIRPALTVHSQQPNVDRRTAPREALLALPNMDVREVKSILVERRATTTASSTDGLSINAGVIDSSLALNGHVFSIKATFSYAGRPVKRDVTIRVTNAPRSGSPMILSDRIW